MRLVIVVLPAPVAPTKATFLSRLCVNGQRRLKHCLAGDVARKSTSYRRTSPARRGVGHRAVAHCGGVSTPTYRCAFRCTRLYLPFSSTFGVYKRYVAVVRLGQVRPASSNIRCGARHSPITTGVELAVIPDLMLHGKLPRHIKERHHYRLRKVPSPEYAEVGRVCNTSAFRRHRRIPQHRGDCRCYCPLGASVYSQIYSRFSDVGEQLARLSWSKSASLSSSWQKTLMTF